MLDSGIEVCLGGGGASVYVGASYELVVKAAMAQWGVREGSPAPANLLKLMSMGTSCSDAMAS